MKHRCKNCKKQTLALIMRDQDGYGWRCETCDVTQRTETLEGEEPTPEEMAALFGAYYGVLP